MHASSDADGRPVPGVGPRVALLVNPASGHGRAAAIGEAVAEHLQMRCDLVVLIGADAAESAGMLAAVTAGAEGAVDAVVVCGGDGIVHLAVNALAGTQLPLGIVPAGSGNDTAAVLGLPHDPLLAAEAAIDALVAGRNRTIDLGQCDGAPVVPGRVDRWFVGLLYAGLDAAVNETANGLRRPRGRRRYDVAIALELLRLRPRRVRLTIDGRTDEIDITLVAVGNGPQYGGGKRMAPDARWDDGLFDITVVGKVSRFTLARLAPTLPRAGHIGHPAVTTFRGRTVTIDGDVGPAYADGERIGPVPVTATCRPGVLRVLTR